MESQRDREREGSGGERTEGKRKDRGKDKKVREEDGG